MMPSYIAMLLACSFMLMHVEVVLLHIQPTPGPHIPHKFADNAAIHDKEHIKKHLENKIDVTKDWDEEKQLFFYFSLSDLNHDQVIDGLEIIKEATHEHPGESISSQEPISEKFLEEMVDSLLKDMDLNNDGVVDFVEFTYQHKSSSSSPPK